MTTLRKLEPGDVAALEALFVALRANGDARFFHPHPLDGDGARTVCRHQGKDYYCATIREGVALAYGMLRGWDEGYEAPSLGIAVHPGSRGRNFGVNMMEHLHEVARAAGASKVRLRVHYDNTRAISLYRRMGYEFPSDVPGAGTAGSMIGWKKLTFECPPVCVPWARPVFWGGEKEAVADAIESTQISGGRYLDEFEHRFAELHGVAPRRVLAVNNGTAALQLALLLAGANVIDADGLGGAPEVIVPGFGFQAAANMAFMLGAKPVFADVLPDTWLIDPDDVARKINARTRAVVAVHTYGNVCDMDALVRLCRARPRIALIEDCAESLFSRYGATTGHRGLPAGVLGDIATFSFQATKTITCGEGGAVIVRDVPEHTEAGRLWRSHGMHPEDRKYVHRCTGFNMRLTNMQAAMLCAQLGHRDEIIERRRFIWDRYCQRLHGYTVQQITATAAPVMWAFGVRLNAHARNEVAAELASKGIETRPGFAAASQQLLYSTPPLPVSEALADEILTLPMPADLAEREFEFIRDSLDAATAK